MSYFIFPLFLLFPSLAAAQNYTLMAPLGNTLTGSPDLSTYLQGVVTVVIGVAGILAMIMLVYCGIRLMVSQSASGRSEAKECIWNAIFGLLLAIGAWVLLYTINPLLLSKDLTLGNIAMAPSANTTPTAPAGIYQSFDDPSCPSVPGKMAQVMPPSTAYCSDWVAGKTCCRYVDTISVSGGTPNPVLTYVPLNGGGGDLPTDQTPATLSATSFSSANFTVNESAGAITLSVTRTLGTGIGTIYYSTLSVGATPGVDYQDVSGTLLFIEGATTRTISIPIINNTQIEGAESIRVTLSNPSGAIALGATTVAMVGIVDDDGAPTVDTIRPTVSITSPLPNRTTTSATVNVTFTATDTSGVGNALIKRLEYDYVTPSGFVNTTVICDGDCTTPTVTMTIPVTITLSEVGTHVVRVRACDSRQCGTSPVDIRVEASCVSDTYVTCKVLPTGASPTWEPTFCSNAIESNGTGLSGVSVLGPTPTFTAEQANQPCYYTVQRGASGGVAVCTDIDYDYDGNPDSYSCPYPSTTWAVVRFTTDANGNGFADEYEYLPDVAYALDDNNDGLMDGTSYPAAKNAIDGNNDGIADGYEFPVNQYLPVMQSCPQAAGAAYKVDAYAFKLTSDNNTIRTVAVSGGNQYEFPAPVGRDGSCPNNPYCRWISSDESGNYWQCTYVPPNVIISISARSGDLTSNPATDYNTESRVEGYCGNTNGNPPGTAETLLKVSTRQSQDGVGGICRVELERTYYVNITTMPFIVGWTPANYYYYYYNGIEYIWDNLYDKYSIFWDLVP
ncbi:MAG: hypothetical protein A3C93_03785 [Candidatus Lloydbacteria bacterium RIFCSPHIGHO2_02_FULL_54_17]|uniref:Calx-beta domain-containing protein n=1 Tax=Candidatus Lloydbacteria bacterium RIFCSPHIGHO2_02_FULL_54_17 TaxID=1798664 RepID=A0A1G2DH57_9BACT|nr:MAG: hypothetical protein A2762_00200 [Candidatus Lloydbacteria bacterium RIFCSPHIGHO2_01_FULL_54_11]OGZ12997.1 MAG: hypothetical protein A3C93_03785 [Candidatus Lloydbacteria bacterium RIFCSPHIGHO2_02_FULL_54_17]